MGDLAQASYNEDVWFRHRPKGGPSKQNELSMSMIANEALMCAQHAIGAHSPMTVTAEMQRGEECELKLTMDGFERVSRFPLHDLQLALATFSKLHIEPFARLIAWEPPRFDGVMWDV